MDDKILEISFSIIALAGDAKNTALEGIKCAKKGEIEEAKSLIEQARKGLVEAHHFQTKLIHAEANGEKTEIGVILIHAQDHLMTSMTFQQLAAEMVDLYEVVYSKS